MRIGFYGVFLSVCVAANIPSELMAEDLMAEEVALAASASVTHYCVRPRIRTVRNDGNFRRQSVILVSRSAAASENPCRRREVNITREVNLNLLDLRLNQQAISQELLVLVSNMNGPGLVGPQGPAGQRGPAGVQGETGQPGLDGAPGLNGLDGTDGQSAYELWLSAGNEGSLADFLAALRGPKGSDGVNGLPGDQGPEGRLGPQGLDGRPGADGAKGDRGDKGDKGDKGDPGDVGERGERGPAGLVGSVAYPNKLGFVTLPNAGRAYLNNSTKVASVTVSANIWCTNDSIGLQAVVRKGVTNFPLEQTRQWDYSHHTGFHSGRVGFSMLVNPGDLVELTRWGMSQGHACWDNVSSIEFLVTELD